MIINHVTDEWRAREQPAFPDQPIKGLKAPHSRTASRNDILEIMNITLPPEQKKWLENEVAAGHYTSIDDAVATAVAELMSINNDDLAWAKPYVEQARASVARGDVIAGEDFFERLNRKLDTLRSS